MASREMPLIRDGELYSSIVSAFNAEAIRGVCRYICNQPIPLIGGSDICPGITILGGNKTDLYLDGGGKLVKFYVDAVTKGGSREPGSLCGQEIDVRRKCIRS